ncbi:MAG: serine hydrolase [Vicingaceae bacterium]
MKIIRIFSSALASLFILVIIALEISGNDHLFKAVASTYLVGQTGPSIDEYHIFPSREVEAAGEIPLRFHRAYGNVKVDEELIQKIEQYEAVSLLILQKGEIIFEQYWEGYSSASKTNSFSVAKSIVGLSIGKCIELELIENLDQAVVDFIPELKGEFRNEVTIRNLLNMASGINFDESYGNPLGFMAKAYYGDELLEKTLQFEAASKPNTEWIYAGGNTILLAAIVQRCSGQNLSDFVSTHFWKPIGASLPALWNLDADDGIEKAYCCFYSNAHDFARLGQVLLDSGRYNGERVINEAFLSELRKPVFLESGIEIPHYGLHWWRMEYRSPNIVYARGILGQYIVVLPELNAVIVRLGKKRGDKDAFEQPEDLYHYVDLAYDICSQVQE